MSINLSRSSHKCYTSILAMQQTPSHVPGTTGMKANHFVISQYSLNHLQLDVWQSCRGQTGRAWYESQMQFSFKLTFQNLDTKSEGGLGLIPGRCLKVVWVDFICDCPSKIYYLIESNLCNKWGPSWCHTLDALNAASQERILDHELPWAFTGN